MLFKNAVSDKWKRRKNRRMEEEEEVEIRDTVTALTSYAPANKGDY